MATIIAAIIINGIIINGIITPAAIAPALLSSSGVIPVTPTPRYVSATSSGPGFCDSRILECYNMNNLHKY